MLCVYPADVLGVQTPRIETIPEYVTTSGDMAVELARHAGLNLDPWQQHVLRYACAERADGTWAAFEVAVIVARQNGKGSILEARQLAGLFLFDERLALHSSHEFKTTIEAFRRIRDLIMSTPDLKARVKKCTTSHGDEGIELHAPKCRTMSVRCGCDGNRLRFVARSTGSGRGFSGDTIYLDEAYNLSAESKAALMPTMSARPNPQLWYTSSAGWGISTALHEVRQRGLRGDEKRLYFAEWSADENNYDVGNPRDWALANPGLGIRISPDFVEAELAAMRSDPALFARERLSIGQWPVGEGGWSVIPEDVWDAAARPDDSLADPVAFSIDVTPDRGWTSIAAAGRRVGHDDIMVDLLEHKPGTEWVVPRALQLIDRYKPNALVVAPRAPVGSILPQLQRALELAGKSHLLMTPTATHEAQACVAFVDGVKNGLVGHRDQLEVAHSLAGARQKETGERLWTWNRKALSVDISPLWAVTLALWGHQSVPGRSKPFVLFD